MQFHPDIDSFARVAAPGTIVPVWGEVLADLETPVSAFLKLGEKGFSFLLESVEGGERLGRYSFLGSHPLKRLRSKGHLVTVCDEKGERDIQLGAGQTPLQVLRNELGRARYVEMEGLPRFVGGAVGYMAYDLVRFFERLPEDTVDDLDLPDTHFMFVDSLVIFDHLKHRMRILANARVSENPEKAYQAACAQVEKVAEALARPLSAPRGKAVGPPARLGLTSNIPAEEYCKMVARAKKYIEEGDVIQVVPSQRLECQVSASALDIYRALRSVNPSPYMYYLSFDDTKIIGSSPEILVTEDRGKVTTRPIAGTAPRGATEKEDERLARDLLGDEKERAEHLMLVDLGRNDLGRVCRYGSVKVNQFMEIEKYSHVMHIVSNVTGVLREDKDQFDVLAACFPAGTVTGAPKVRAMEIIEELEPTRRGPYAGAIGYFSLSGNMDTCIAIRTLILEGDKAYAQAGGGVVADSVPEKEYRESLNKAQALVRAIEMAEEGLA